VPLVSAVVFTLGLSGLAVSAYVWHKQVTTGPVLCLGDGCARVIRSPYGRLLGVPNGALGVAYFGLAALVPLFLSRFAEAWLLLRAATVVALVLYAYLTYLQLAVIRALCVWCLTSAALTVALFLST